MPATVSEDRGGATVHGALPVIRPRSANQPQRKVVLQQGEGNSVTADGLEEGRRHPRPSHRSPRRTQGAPSNTLNAATAGLRMGAVARVALVGPGAIGSVVAAAVQQAGRHDLMLCARRDPGTVRILDERSGAETTLACRVLTSPDYVGAASPWVLLAVKAHQTEGASGYLSRLCAAETTAVVLQNGVEHVARVARHVNGATILPGIVWISAETVESGLVTVGAEMRPRIQVPSGNVGTAFAKLMEGGLLDVELVDDFTTALWRKLAVNALTCLMALTGCRMGVYRREDIGDLARAMAAECLAVARAEGAKLPETSDALVEHFRALPPDTGSSILFDRLADRQLEWDALIGVIRRFGRRHGIATPVSDVVTPLLAAISDGCAVTPAR